MSRPARRRVTARPSGVARAAATAPGRPVPLRPPDPPLADPAAGIALRPWQDSPTDAAAVVAAWRDPRLATGPSLPDEVSVAAASRWIRGEPARRAAGLCLDLVIGSLDSDAVVGEVGLRNVDRVRGRAEISWWIAAEHRGRGLAAAAARLLAGWALSPGGGLEQVWARTDPANRASAAVAAAAGFEELGEADGTVVWSRTRARPERPPRSGVPQRP